jgi:hypothetical protein
MIGSDSVSMGSSVLVGLAVTSHDDTALNTATFTNVSVTGSASAPMTLARSAEMIGSDSESSDQAAGEAAGASDVTTTSSAAELTNAARPTVKVNVPLVSGSTGKTVVKKPATVTVNVPVIAKAKRTDVPEVETR